MLLAYKYRLYPNKSQIKLIDKHIGSCRFIYNYCLDRKINTYKETGKSVSRFDLNKEITELKKDKIWLTEVNSQSLQGMTLNLENAYLRFFKEKIGFPNFKSKKNPVQSFPIPQHYKIINGNKIHLPKIGKVKIKLHRHFDGILKTATVSKTSSGKYFISILVDNEKEYPEPEFVTEVLGIDLGIKDFAVLSSGERIKNPKYLGKSLKRLEKVQRKFSNNKTEKLRLIISKVHEKVSNQRNDFLNKLSTRLVSENQAIAIESLNIQSMLKYRNLSRNILDSSWSSFTTMLEYKAKIKGKTILKIGRFEPSSKTCSKCNFVNTELTLEQREWTCPNCNSKLDRDFNASINIMRLGLQSLQVQLDRCPSLQ